MPVRSSHSSVLKWPDPKDVREAVQAWGRRQAKDHPKLMRLGLFGSYARGDAGVGSDLDLVAILSESDEPFEQRAVGWDTLALPLPAELLVYTSEEWDRMRAAGSRFAATVEREAIWLFRSG